jgi:hypothetical protein
MSLAPLNEMEVRGRVGPASMLCRVGTGSTASSVIASDFSTAPNRYQNGLLRFMTGQLAGQEQPISSHTATTFTVASAFTAAPAVGDIFVIIPESRISIEPGVPNTTLSAPTVVSVGTAAVRIDQGTPGRIYIVIVNNGTGAIYVGRDNTVTTANGLPIGPGASATFNLGPNLELWAVSTATQDVRVMEAA